jgi:uncharacterized protein (TIGR03067 family)
MRTLLLVLAVAAPGFAPAPVPRPDRGRAERNQLAGTWVVKTIKHAGSAHWQGAGLGTLLLYVSGEVRFSDREMHVVLDRDTRARSNESLEIEVQKGTRQIDFLEKSARRTPAIYRLEGGTLTIRYPPNTNKPRPTTFDDPNGILIIMERARR